MEIHATAINGSVSTARLLENGWIYKMFMHFNTCSNTLSTVVVMWLMMKKTPDSMRVYKYFLINISVCSYLMDTFVTLFFVPMTLLPVSGGCTLGILSFMGPQATMFSWWIFNFLLGMCGISLSYALLFRLASIHNKAHLMTKGSVLLVMAVVQLLYSMPSWLGAIILHPSNEENVAYITREHPELLDFFVSHSCSMLVIDNSQLPIYMALIFVEISAISTYTCALMVTILRHLRSTKDKMSKKTYRMHQSLFTSLVYQWTVPTAMLTFSYLALGAAVVMGTRHSQVVSFFAFQFSTLHSTANSILVLVFIRPYRDALLSYIRAGKNFKSAGASTGTQFVIVAMSVELSRRTSQIPHMSTVG